MPQFSKGGPVPVNDPVTVAGALIGRWPKWFLLLDTQIGEIQTTVNTAFGLNRFTLAGQPTLGMGDVGYVGFVTDYSHSVYWDGAAWQWLDGDRPYRFSDFAAAPGTGWGLCDGSTYAMLVIGAGTLTTANFTTPNLSGSAHYKKSGNAYAGTLNAAGGSTAGGTTSGGTTGTSVTGTDVTGVGTTGTGTTGTGVSGGPNTTAVSSGIGATSFGDVLHTHNVPGLSVPGLSVPALTIPALTIPGLSVPGLTVPALGVGTLDMANLVVLPYVRR